jgi:hypothetical protein
MPATGSVRTFGPKAPAAAASAADETYSSLGTDDRKPVFKEVTKARFKELYFRLGGGKRTGWTAEYWDEFFEKKVNPNWKFMVEEPRSSKHVRMYISSDKKSEEYRMYFLTEEDEDSFFD